MLRFQWILAILLISVVSVASGCAPNSLGLNRGPSAYLSAAKIQNYSADRDKIINALAKDFSVSSIDRNYYFNVTIAGFSYVDALCSDYFNDLFVLERNRQAVKASLNAFGQTTNAILKITDASSLSMAIVVQAFGLATTMTDIVANTYLYRLPPATTLKFVKELQRAYKSGASAAKNEITTKSQAFDNIQEYLSFCLPPVIEANLIEHIGSTEAVAVVGSGGATKVVFGTARNATERAQSTTLTRVITPSDPVEPTRKPGEIIKGAIGRIENTISLGRGIRIQQALCVTNPNGDFGADGSKTRAAIKSWGFGRFGEHGNGIIDKPNELSALEQTVSFVGECKSSGYVDAYEVGLLSDGVRLRDFATKMYTLLQAPQGSTFASAIKVNVDALKDQKKIDSNFRKAVQATKQAVELPGANSTISPVLDSKMSDALDAL